LDLLAPLHPVAPPSPPIFGEPEGSRPGPESLEAQARASEILERAQREAERLVEDARVQADVLREAAWQEGFHDGQTTGRSAMEMTLRDEWEAEKAALRAQIRQIVDDIATARQALWEGQEAEMVALTLAVARQVIKTEVTQNPEVVRSVIQNALRRLTDKEQVRLRVSVGDAPAVRAMREELLAMTDGLRQLEIVDDRRVGDGGCVIETGAGTIDAKIETQLLEVERAVGIIPLPQEPVAVGAND
jgi:flagellar assembly protein FliH